MAFPGIPRELQDHLFAESSGFVYTLYPLDLQVPAHIQTLIIVGLEPVELLLRVELDLSHLERSLLFLIFFVDEFDRFELEKLLEQLIQIIQIGIQADIAQVALVDIFVLNHLNQ